MPVVPAARQVEVAADIERFVRWTLAPAGTPPPSVHTGVLTAEDRGLRVRAAPIRPEEADWNTWRGGGPRLFNNRMAYLFEVRIEGPAPLRWNAPATTIELNDTDTLLYAAPSPEAPLADLISFAWLQEDTVLDGDLVARTRAAGPFRDAYLPLTTETSVLEGLIAFPTGGPDGVAELHVVALRLTVDVDTGDGPRAVQLLWD